MLALHRPRLAAIAATVALTLAPVALRAQDAAQPSSPTTSTQAPTSAMTAQARAEYDALSNGKVDRSHYGQDVDGVDDATVTSVAQRLHARGPVVRFAFERAMQVGDETVYVYRISSQNGPDLNEAISWDGDGKISRLIILQAP